MSNDAHIYVDVTPVDHKGDRLKYARSHGRFDTPGEAGRFAVGQATAVCAATHTERVAVLIDVDLPTGTRPDLDFVGVLDDLESEIVALAEYAVGVGQYPLPAPDEVNVAIGETFEALFEARAPSSSPSTDVEVFTTRLHPLPPTRTDVGTYDTNRALWIAHDLAARLDGSVTWMREDTALRVVHSDYGTDADFHTIAQYERAERVRAEVGALDPVRDADRVAALAEYLDALALQASTPLPASVASSHGRGEVLDREFGVLTDPVLGADSERIDARPRGLVQPPNSTATSRTDTTRHPPERPVDTRSAWHGIGFDY